MTQTEDDVFTDDRSDAERNAWIKNIADTLASCESAWNVRTGDELRQGLVGYLVEAECEDGTQAVLKLRSPGEAMDAEAEALQLFGGRGAARLIACNSELGAILMERAVPGSQLSDCLSEIDGESVMVDVIRNLDRSATPKGLMSVSDRVSTWARGLRDLSGPSPLPLGRFVEAADSLDRLAGSQGEPVVLHGDLHVGNVLNAGDSWIAVDPKGLFGEIEYDIAWWLRDPPTDSEPEEWTAQLTRRLDLLSSEFEADRDRLLEWARSFAAVITGARVAAEIYGDAARHSKCVLALDAVQ